MSLEIFTLVAIYCIASYGYVIADSVRNDTWDRASGGECVLLWLILILAPLTVAMTVLLLALGGVAYLLGRLYGYLRNAFLRGVEESR